MAAEWVLDEFGVAHFDDSISWLRQLQFSSEDTQNTVNTDTPCCISSEGSGGTFSPCPGQTSPHTSDTHFEENHSWLHRIRETSLWTQDQANVETLYPTESDESEVPISPCPGQILPAIRTPKRAIEYRPRHSWTLTQKKFLCALYKRFEPEYDLFTSVFNKAYATNLSPTKIRSMADNLRLFQRGYQHIYDDGSTQDQLISTLIMPTCKSLGIRLQPRQSDLGGALTKKSAPRSRKRLKALVQNSSSVDKASSTQDSVDNTITAFSTHLHPSLYRGELAISDGPDEYTEDLCSAPTASTPNNLFGMHFTELEADVSHEPGELIEDISSIVQSNAPYNLLSTPFIGLEFFDQSETVPRRIAFRCWDETSWTQYSPGNGFRSRLADEALWNYAKDFPSLKDSSNLSFESDAPLLLLCLSHLSQKSGSFSPFVSVTTSLLQCMTYASRMNNPCVAVVDLDRIADKHLLEAGQVLKALKKHSQAQWARYRGTAEILVWGHIPATAIINVVEYSSVIGESPLCQHIEGKRACGRNAQALQALDTLMSPATAFQMGNMASKLLCNGKFDVGTVAFIVEKIVDALKIGTAISSNEMARCKASFSWAVRMGGALRARPDLLERSFEEGCLRGKESIQFWSRSSSGKNKS